MNTLYKKLALTVFGIFVVSAAVFILGAGLTLDAYIGETNQKLNRNLADNILVQSDVFHHGEAGDEEIKSLFHSLMGVHPSIEAYVIASDGHILNWSPTKDKIERTSVAVQPIKAFLAGELPVRGDDPRDTSATKVFSAAMLNLKGNGSVKGGAKGYLYIILSGQDAKSTAQMVQGSYILKLAALALVISLAILHALALFLFNFVTRRLNRLVEVMREFRNSNFSAESARYLATAGPNDEVDQLGLTFNAMADLISEQLARLLSSDLSRKELAENISHDVRRPLASLQGYVETLILKFDTLPTDVTKNYLQRALKCSHTCVRLISELFQLSRLEAKDGPLNLEVFSPMDLLEDVTQEYSRLAGECGVGLKTDFENDLPMVRADIALIERVVNNLLDNAFRHTPPGGRVTVSLASDPNGVLVKVCDTGCGIPQESISKIFDRTYQRESGASPEQHAGLGLAISKRILELHGGELKVSSQPGNGTTFSFLLCH